jgi:hypothetical protein
LWLINYANKDGEHLNEKQYSELFEAAPVIGLTPKNCPSHIDLKGWSLSWKKDQRVSKLCQREWCFLYQVSFYLCHTFC